MNTSETLHLPPLPYPQDALAPHISADTVSVHYGKHHAGYVANVNRLVAGTAAEGAPLEDLIGTTAGGLFNNAAQVWNHTFYWGSMHPDGGGDPSGDLLAAIEEDFGSTDGFRKQFTDASCGHFGSGWVWLVAGGDRLEVMSTSNADLPQRHDRTPLADHRRLGARLLPGLPQRPSGVRGALDREPRELGVRRGEPGGPPERSDVGAATGSTPVVEIPEPPSGWRH